MIFKQKFTTAGGKQTIVTKCSISNDFLAQTTKAKPNARITLDHQHGNSIRNGSEQLFVARERRQLDVDQCSSRPSSTLERL